MPLDGEECLGAAFLSSQSINCCQVSPLRCSPYQDISGDATDWGHFNVLRLARGAPLL